MPYDLKTIHAPRLAGFSLKAAAALADRAPTKPLIAPSLLKAAGIEAFREARLTEAPSVAPPLPRSTRASDDRSEPLELDALATRSSAPGFAFETVADFAQAYRERQSSPEAVAERVLEAIAASNAREPALRAIIASVADDVRAQARESAERYRKGAALSALDGVPVAVKDELDVRGYPTTAGTKFLREVATSDATAVARLRAAGAVIIGKANMHEIGIDTSGFNAHHGTPRNPYAPGRYPGGSSSGSAAAVAAGLCPIAVGADGGGSIRIPAALCGVVGLKATFSRVSEAGAFPLCWSVGHVGPLAGSVRDAALAYALMAGPDPRDANTLGQPPPSLAGLEAGVRGMRLGLYRPWFEDADPEVVEVCRALVARLVEAGAEVVEVELPDLELARLAHGITILSEMATSLDAYDHQHRSDYAAPVRLNLALARELTARDYVRAQQVRTRFFGHVERALAKADVIVTPATARVAPVIAPDVLPAGESDLALTSALMRFVFPANLTGHPAVSFPAGYAASGAPIGLQAMGRVWDEARLFQLARAAEKLVERRAPELAYRLLAAAPAQATLTG